MEGKTSADIDRSEELGKDTPSDNPPLRPRDAATLLLLDRSKPTVRVLMGKRSSRHVFMPGKFVFPGGRTDPNDSRITVATPLHPTEEQKLVGTGSRATPTRARAIALSAIRETYEEAGILIGQKGQFSTNKTDWQGFVEHGVVPSLADIRYLARFITPPGKIRRYDTRFLSVWRDTVAVELPEGGPTDELEELVWLPLKEAQEIDLPRATGIVLEELTKRLAVDPELSPGGDVSYYRMLHGKMRKAVL